MNNEQDLTSKKKYTLLKIWSNFSKVGKAQKYSNIYCTFFKIKK